MQTHLLFGLKSAPEIIFLEKYHKIKLFIFVALEHRIYKHDINLVFLKSLLNLKAM